MSRIKRLLEREITENRKLGTDWIYDLKDYVNRFFSRFTQEIDFDYQDDDDLLLLRDTKKLYEQGIDELENYIHTMNYQIELIERIGYDMKETKDRLDRIERKLDKK